MDHAPQHRHREPIMPQMMCLGVCPRYLQPSAIEAEGNERSDGMKLDGEAAIDSMAEDERTAHRSRPTKCQGTCRRRKPHHTYSITA